ncbi:MAG: cysteine hydrolase [Chloroflexi bacterium]|nr:cysteine hydrolase [Chloroflexota bacterium]
MVDYAIRPEKTALILFDMVNEFIKPGAPRENPEIREKLVPKLRKLITVCRTSDIPVIYTNHCHRADGSDLGVLEDIYKWWRKVRPGKVAPLIEGTPGTEVYHEIAPQKGDIIVKKHRFSAFCGTDLDMILRHKGIDTIILTGATTNIGPETTVRDATVRDYKVIFPSDGNLSRDLPDMGWGPVTKEEIDKVALSTMQYCFARVLTIEELISELS